MKNLTPELIAKAKAAESAEELFELAKANDIELTEEEAKTYFEQLNASGPLSDDDLDAVAGGSFCDDIKDFFNFGDGARRFNNQKCRICGSTTDLIPCRVNTNTLGGINQNNDYLCAQCGRQSFAQVTPDLIEKI